MSEPVSTVAAGWRISVGLNHAEWERKREGGREGGTEHAPRINRRARPALI